MITCATLIVPTPEPYNETAPNKQRENLAYVALQMIGQMQQTGDVIEPGLTQAVQDLKYNGQIIDLGPLKIQLTGQTLSILQ